MQHDPLAQFRRKPLPPGYEPPRKEPDKYLAFETKDTVFRLRIRSLHEPVHSPAYHLLLDLVYDGQHGTHFMLVFTMLAVLVRGKNLQRVIFAIENGMADYIQEYDPSRWPKPTDDAEPFIESIEIRATGDSSANMETIH